MFKEKFMKHKFLAKIATVTLGLAMAVGVSVGVVSNKEPKPVYAATSYEQLTSIANIDETANYVLGIDGTGFHYSGTSSWGLTALPSAETPLYYTLEKAANGQSFTASTTIGSTKYYLQVPTSNTFSMSTSTGTNTDLIIGTTQVSETNYAVANKNTTTRHLRRNGTNGLRSYATSTGSMAFFYKVVTSFEPTTYTVTYDANGGTGTMTDSNSPYSEGATVTVLNNTFSRDGYSFVCFNTQANGFGTDYNPTNTFTINGNTTLYAKWKYPHTDVDNQVTWDLTKTSYTTMGAESATWVSEHVIISASKDTSTSATNAWCPPEKDQTRFYKNSSLTISPVGGYKINSIVFTAGNTDYANALKNSTWTNASATSNSTTVTVVPTTKINDVSVILGAVSGVNQIVVNYAVYSALDSIALSGTYPTAFNQGDSFSHEGMVVTATYENGLTADVTSSATWSGYNMSGSGSQTVTVSYSEELVEKTATYTITVTVAPFIDPAESSISGQVGEDDSILYDYGSLTSNTINVVSSNESIVTIGDNIYENETGLVEIFFVGSGSTTVVFKDGEIQRASVTVTVTRTAYVSSKKMLSADLTVAATCTEGFDITKNDNCKKDGDHHKDGGTANSEVNYFVVKRASVLFSIEPASISFSARLRGGTARDPLNNNVEACFVDSEGVEIESTKRTVTTKVTATPTNYTISLPYSSDACGVKLMHLKESEWNVYYYSFELSFDYASSVKTITATEVKDGNGTTTSVESVKLRFGAQLSSDNWTAFNSEHTIEDYGVMFARKTVLDANSLSSVKAAFESRQSSLLIVGKGSGTAPSLSGSNRVFTAYLTIDSSDYNTVFCATPFILAGGQYYFLDEMRYSVKTLAAECQTTHGSPLSDEALAILNA